MGSRSGADATEGLLPGVPPSLNLTLASSQLGMDGDADLLHILRKFVTGWELADGVSCSRLAGAMSNEVYKCASAPGDGCASNAPPVLLRLYGTSLGSGSRLSGGHEGHALLDREAEVANACFLGGLGVGLGPAILCLLPNGRLEEWLDGQALSSAAMRGELAPDIAAALAAFHLSSPGQGCAVRPIQAAAQPSAPERPLGVELWERIEQWTLLAETEGAATPFDCAAAAAALRAALQPFSEQEVLCHNDLQHGCATALPAIAAPASESGRVHWSACVPLPLLPASSASLSRSGRDRHRRRLLQTRCSVRIVRQLVAAVTRVVLRAGTSCSSAVAACV